jgi:hypothetical protein
MKTTEVIQYALKDALEAIKYVVENDTVRFEFGPERVVLKARIYGPEEARRPSSVSMEIPCGARTEIAGVYDVSFRFLLHVVGTCGYNQGSSEDHSKRGVVEFASPDVAGLLQVPVIGDGERLGWLSLRPSYASKSLRDYLKPEDFLDVPTGGIDVPSFGLQYALKVATDLADEGSRAFYFMVSLKVVCDRLQVESTDVYRLFSTSVGIRDGANEYQEEILAGVTIPLGMAAVVERLIGANKYGKPVSVSTDGELISFSMAGHFQVCGPLLSREFASTPTVKKSWKFSCALMDLRRACIAGSFGRAPLELRFDSEAEQSYVMVKSGAGDSVSSVVKAEYDGPSVSHLFDSKILLPVLDWMGGSKVEIEVCEPDVSGRQPLVFRDQGNATFYVMGLDAGKL